MKSKMKGLVLSILMIFIGLISFPGLGQAKVETIFVEDQANVLADQDIEYIRDMNEKTFKNLDGEPQFAVVTLKDLGNSSIEEYSAKKFAELGVGQAELNNGFLFVIAIDDREYRLETGYGVEAVITDSMKDQIVGDEVTDLLRDEEYSQAIRKISENINQIVVDRYSDYAVSVAQVTEQKAAQAKRNRIFGMIAGISVATLSLGSALTFGIVKFRRNQRRKYFIKELSSFADPKFQLPQREPKAKSAFLVETVAYNLTKAHKKDLSAKQLQKALAETYLRSSVTYYIAKNPESTYSDPELYLKKAKHYQEFLKTVVLPLFKPSQPLSNNRLFVGTTFDQFESYLEKVTVTHKLEVSLSQNNQNTIRKVCQNYLNNLGEHYKDEIDAELMVNLMVFVLLAGKDLTDPHLIDEKLTNQEAMTRAYKEAKKKRKSIEQGYRSDALNDLNFLMYNTYFIQSTMTWSHYNSSSSASSGGSSFGGGASGGGGFSGSW